MKLNVNLALTDTLRSKFKNMVKNYMKFFSSKQSAFKGIKKTYAARDGYADLSEMKEDTLVITTVKEKFDYFIKEGVESLNTLMTTEKTNSSGAAKATLIVDGVEWGEFTSLELLRMRSLLEAGELGDLTGMLNEVPTRSESEIWATSDIPQLESRGILANKMQSGIKVSSEKSEHILEDINLKNMKDTSNYKPVVTAKTKIIEVGDYTMQKFSGEVSQYDKADMLRRKNLVVIAVVKALKECNNCETVKSNFSGQLLLEYMFYGKNKE